MEDIERIQVGVNTLAEDQFGTGFVYKPLESTDRFYSIGSSEPVDWYRNLNIQDELKKKLGSSFLIPVNNQYQTLSCVGQAWSKYGGVRKVFGDINPNWVEFSPRDVYSHICLPQGGAWLIDGGLFCRKGVLPEEQLPPHWSGKSDMVPTEEIMRDRGLEGGLESGDNANPNVYDGLRQLVKGGSVEHVGYDINSIAQAIRDNHGVVLAVYGENNGTWLTRFPRTGSMSWGHAVLALGYMYINGKKYILILNSWGKNVGEGGWQLLGEEWFGNNRYIGGANTWSPEVGNILRASDFEKILKYIEDNNLMDTNFYAPDAWKDIQLSVNSDILSGDFYNYCQIKKLI